MMSRQVTLRAAGAVTTRAVSMTFTKVSGATCAVEIPRLCIIAAAVQGVMSAPALLQR